jgi:adenylate cyclase
VLFVGGSTRLRTILIIRISAILLITVLLIGANLFVRANKQVESITTRIISSSVRLIDQRLDGLVEGAESQASLLATSLIPWISEPSEVTRAAPSLLSLLRTNPEFSSASIILDSTGEMVRAQRQNDQTVAVQHSVPERSSFRRTDYAPFGSRLLRLGSESWSFDTRSMPYYREAKLAKKAVWSDTYLIRSPSGLDAPGVTCAAPIFDGEDRVLGIVTIDFTLGDLSRFLQTIQPGETGYAFLAERSANGIRIVAHPKANRILVTDGGRQRIATLSEVNDPLLTRLIEPMTSAATEQEGVQEVNLSIEGQRVLVGMQPVRPGSSPDWMVVIVVPESDYISGLREQALVVLIITCVALVGAIAGSILLANKVTEPLQALVAETDKIRSLELEPRPMPQTPVKEIQDLSKSMEQMKTGLRSLQKLVPAEYARHLISSGQEARLGGERRHMSISFADLIGFTAISEVVPPEVLSRILSEYLDVISNEILKKKGTIDKFNGDDVMAFWGAPLPIQGHALAACETALASKKTLSSFYGEWEQAGIPRLRVSWGLATGDVVVGNVGSRERMNYTVIGDVVNLASRLQGINRAYDTEILVSAATRAEAGPTVLTRLVDWVIPLGKEQSVEIYELCSLAEGADPSWPLVIATYEEALRRYKERKWDQAEEGFRRVLDIRGTDGPSKTLLTRIDRHRAFPPEPDWDGSHRIGSK